MKKLYRVSLPYCTYDMWVKDGKIIDVDWKGSWAKGKDINEYKKWLKRHKGTMRRLKEIEKEELKVVKV